MAESYLKALAEELSGVLSSESVIGEPIIQDDKVLIPVTKLGFAVGSGSGKSSGRETGGEGTGGGGGGGVEPIALIAVFKNIPGPEGVQVIPLKAPSKMPEVIEKALESFANMQEKKNQPKQEVEEEPTEQT
ncbi:unnamed protein product [marine sediment metagenome]|uniref:Sporulation protein YtfJ n=1 Tax=marine sediment metagenome TaxID=412755 RepID=X1LSN2_9ZZZZ